MPLFILASIGDPWMYKRVVYHLGTDSGKISKDSIVSISVLAEAAERSGSEPSIFLVVQESLLAARRGPNRGYELLSPERIIDYPDLLDEMVQAVRDFINTELNLDGDIVVENMPVQGVFGGQEWDYRVRWSIAEDVGVDMYGHYYSIALAKILKILLERIDGREPLEVWVDTTHGINYAGLAFLRASLQAARIVAALMGVSVRFRQYNSEPYVPGVSKELRVHLVREEIITPKRAASRLVYTMVQVDPREYLKAWRRAVVASKQYMGDRYGSVAKSISESITRVASWLYMDSVATGSAASIMFGAPLLLLQSGRWALDSASSCGGPRQCVLGIVDSLLSMVDPIYSKAAGSPIGSPVEPRVEPGEVHLTYTILPSRRPLTSMLAAAALAGYAAYAHGTLCPHESCSPPSSARSVRRGVCVPLCLLRKARDEYIAGPVWKLVEHELSQIDRFSKKKPPSTAENLYQNVYQATVQGTCAQPDEPGNPDSRIFQAHAGLPSGITGACPSGGQPCLYYVYGSEYYLAYVSKDLLSELYNALAS